MCLCVCVRVDDTALQRVEAALASAWGGSGPAPLRPAPPSLFVALENMGADRGSPSKNERDKPFGFVRDELARISLESKGSSTSRNSNSRSSNRRGGQVVEQYAAQGREQQLRLQLRSSSSSSRHSSDSEDSLQADLSATVIQRGIRSIPGSSSSSSDTARAANVFAHGSDSEVTTARPSEPYPRQTSPTSPLLAILPEFRHVAGRAHRLGS